MSFPIIFSGLLVIMGHAFKVLFDKTKIPDVIPMVLVGLLMGPIFGLMTPEKFGIMGDLLGTLSLSIILFYSGLEINLETANKSLAAGSYLAAFNFLLAVVLGAAVSMLLLDLPLIEAFGIGAILGGTSFAIVIPMVSDMKLAERTKTILLLESTFTDVFCIIISLGIFQMIRLSEMNPGFMTGQVLASFVMSSIIGGVCAFFWATALRWVRTLKNDMLLTPAVIITIYGFTEFLGYSGALSSLAFGVVSGNIRKIASHPMLSRFPADKIMEFNVIEMSLFSELVFVLKTFFFFYIGLSIRMTSISMAFAGVALVALIVGARFMVAKATLGQDIEAIDKAAISIMTPKGLVTVVLLSLAAKSGFREMEAVQELVYSTVLASIIISALLAFFLERGKLAGFYTRVFGEPIK